MALLELTYYSRALDRSVSVNVLLPADTVCPGGYAPVQPYQTLYLLHGYTGSHTDWVNYTRLPHLAQERKLAVVMPAGENSYYIDHPWGDYGTLVGQELVEMTRRMFPLSHRREDTFLAGLSMGGFGAMRNGLKYSATFQCIGSFSGAFHFFEREQPQIHPRDVLFGDLAAAAGTDANPRVAWCNATAPCRIFMACGTGDELLPSNRRLRDFLLEQGADLTYMEWAGGHDWDFWNRCLREFLDWLPLRSIPGETE